MTFPNLEGHDRDRCLLTPITMAFATPWQPTLNGNLLQPCDLIHSLVEKNVEPDPRKSQEERWSLAGVRLEIGKVPEAREALLECVTAIWRLQKTEEDGAESEEWRNHLIAWLVSPQFHSTPAMF